MYHDTRERILRTAITLYAKHGLDNVTMREIAFDAGISRNELAAYFTSKEILIGSILEYIPRVAELYDPTRLDLEEQLKMDTPQEVLRRFYNFYGWGNENLLPYVYRFLYMELYKKSAVSRLAEEVYICRPITILKNTLNTLVDLSAIPPCDTKALAQIWHRTSLMYGILATHFDGTISDDEYREMTEFFIDLAVSGVKTIPLEQIEMKWVGGGLEERNEDETDEKRLIMRKALDLFVEYGYSKVTVRKIADKLGLPVSTVYRYYSSKSDIMKDIVEGLISAFTEHRFQNPELEMAIEKGDQERLILTLAMAYPPSREEEVLKLYSILMSEQYFNEDLKDFFLASLFRDRRRVTAFLDELVADGHIRKCNSEKIAIAYVYTMVSLTFAATVPRHDHKDLDDQRKQTTALLVSLARNCSR